MIPIVESPHKIAWLVGKLRPPATTATIIVKGTYDLRPGSPSVPSPEPADLLGDLFAGDDPKKELLYPSDFAPFKPKADLLVVGHVHAPGGRPVDVLRATVHVGSYSKSIAVIGDRVFARKLFGGRPGTPQPFVKIPLSYTRAFGGPGYRKNPLGMGNRDETAPDGSTIKRLPNLESATNLLVDSDVNPDPAGFGPIPMTWDQRMRRAGTYGAKWLKERWPAFPEDFDWGYFNSAPEDQQLPAYWKGNERLRFENLHPKHPVYESALPGVRIRCLLGEPLGSAVRVREIEMNLDTLVADLDAERLFLVWRGRLDLALEDFAEEDVLYVVDEPLARPPSPTSEYERRIREFVAEEEDDEDDNEEEPEAEEEKPAPAPAPAAPPAPEAGAPEPEWAAFEKSLPKPPPAPAAPVPPADPAQLQKLNAALGVGPAVEEPVPDVPPVQPPPSPAAPDAAWCLARKKQKEGLDGLDLTGIDLSGRDFSGASFRETILRSANLRGCRLAGADLGGAVLAEADLAEADLTKANLAGADLTGARLLRAKLPGAKLGGALAQECLLAGADLSGADAAGAILARSNLSRADLRGAKFPEADLSECNLHDADLRGAVLSLACVEKSWGSRLQAEKSDLTGLRAAESSFGESDFRGAKAAGSVWLKSRLFRADFRGALLEKAEFERATLIEARFSGADLRLARLVAAVLRKCDLTRANLFRANLEGADLAGADASESNLFEAGLFEAKTRDARWSRANLRRTVMSPP